MASFLRLPLLALSLTSFLPLLTSFLSLTSFCRLGPRLRESHCEKHCEHWHWQPERGWCS